MMKGGWERKGGPRTLEDEIGYNFACVFNKKRLYGASKIEPVLDFVESQRAIFGRITERNAKIRPE